MKKKKKTIRDIKAEERKEKEQEKITNKEKIKSKKTVLPDDEKDKAKKIKPKKTKEEKYIEFPYIDEIDSMDLLTIKNPCQCDPGLTNPMTVTKPNGDVYKYTNKQHLKRTKRKKHMKKINNIKKNLNIIQVESELSNYNSKSVSTEEYISYCSKKLEINKILESSYENIKFRQYKWYNYICRERAYGKMLNEFENVLGKDATLIIGDASLGVNM